MAAKVPSTKTRSHGLEKLGDSRAPGTPSHEGSWNPGKHLRSPGEAKTKLRFKPKPVDGAVMCIRSAVLSVAPGLAEPAAPWGWLGMHIFGPFPKVLNHKP